MTKAVCMSVVLAILACLAAPAAGESLLPAGDHRAAWVIRQATSDAYDVVAKPAGEDWRRVADGLQGRPTTAVALDSQLHVLLSNRDYVIFDLDSPRPVSGLKPNHPRWPDIATIVAACGSGPLAGVQASRTIVVVLATTAPATSTQPSPACAAAPPPPPTTPASPPIPAGQALALFFLQSGKWTYLEDVPAPAGQPGQHVMAACFDGQLYLLLSGPERTQMLVRDRSGTWMPQRAMPDLLPPSSKPLALVALKDSLLLARRDKGQTTTRALANEVSLIAIERNLATATPQAIALPGPAAAAQDVQVFSYAEGVGLVWPQSPAPGFAACDPNARVKVVESIGLLAQAPVSDHAEKAYEYFIYALFALVLLNTFLRMRQPRVLFSLPPGIRPARLLRRAVACLIDLVPFTLLGYKLFPFPLPDAATSAAEQVVFMKQLATNLQAALAVITTYALHGVYCLVMESQFGTTLGKRLLGLRVVGAGGKKAKPYEILCRTVLRILELSVFPVPIITVACMFMTRCRQRVGDLLAQTAVVEGFPTATTQPAEPPPLPPDPRDDDRPATPPS